MSMRDSSTLLESDNGRLAQVLAMASDFSMPQLLAMALDPAQTELVRRLAATLAALQDEYLPGRFGRYSRHDLLLLQAAGRFIEVASSWQLPEGLPATDHGGLRPYIPAEPDWEHSALFQRIRSGLAPLPYPPPTSGGQPWYAVVEIAGVYPVVINAAQAMGHSEYPHVELNGCPWQVLAHLLPDGREIEGAPAVFRDDCSYVVCYGRWPDFLLFRGRTANRCSPEYARQLVEEGGDDIHPSPRILPDAPDENGWVQLEYDHWMLRQRYPARDAHTEADGIARDRQIIREGRITQRFPLCQQRFEDADLNYDWDAERPENSTVYRVRTLADQMRMSYPELADWSDKSLVIAAGLTQWSPAERDPDLFVRLYEYELHADYMSGGAFASIREARFMGGRFEDSYRQQLARRIAAAGG
ncbi:hypothetical protein [Chitinilyticum piscinae]|uniref:Uncharacterized protein n=1 Tax=Chitinilyticum piscinae TaxID=2866724 RepID=A0A8J7K113_9NEIS|nr:hypothetical protein [Chitinilyticum piscinae]MBE9607942.1 hypothetical protein [Chitinilyticum piscinae]